MAETGKLIIFSGPSGAGKDTVLLRYLQEAPAGVWKSVSYTTRQPRDGETDGVDYHFVSTDVFEEQIQNGNMLEYTRYGLHYYGTPKAPVDAHLRSGDIVILKIEVEGAANIKKLYPDAVGVFIMPPGLDVLEQRLRARGTETEEDILRRLRIAAEEMAMQDQYEHLIINDTIEKAVDDLKRIVRSYQ